MKIQEKEIIEVRPVHDAVSDMAGKERVELPELGASVQLMRNPKGRDAYVELLITTGDTFRRWTVALADDQEDILCELHRRFTEGDVAVYRMAYYMSKHSSGEFHATLSYDLREEEPIAVGRLRGKGYFLELPPRPPLESVADAVL